MMTDCVGIAKIAMRLCSGVFGMCQDCTPISGSVLQDCKGWHARACRLVPLVHVDAIGNTLCSSCCHGWLAIYTVLFSCAGSSSSSIYPGGLVQELL